MLPFTSWNLQYKNWASLAYGFTLKESLLISSAATMNEQLFPSYRCYTHLHKYSLSYKFQLQTHIKSISGSYRLLPPKLSGQKVSWVCLLSVLSCCHFVNGLIKTNNAFMTLDAYTKLAKFVCPDVARSNIWLSLFTPRERKERANKDEK